jgi:hypothetical protein
MKPFDILDLGVSRAGDHPENCIFFACIGLLLMNTVGSTAMICGGEHEANQGTVQIK